jgi:hypothetical protein
LKQQVIPLILFFLVCSTLGFGVVKGEEFDNVDTFNVHPGSGRWEITSDGYDSVISNGLLNMTDVGDLSTDYILLQREIRKLDGRITLKWKYDVSANHSTSTSQMYFGLDDGNGSYIRYYVEDPHNNTYADYTRISFLDDTDVVRSIDLDSDERYFDDEWYITRIDYNVLESEFKLKNRYENLTTVCDYDFYEVTQDYRPKIFSGENLIFSIYSRTRCSGVKFELLVEYVNAPYNSHEWKNYDVPTDATFVYNSGAGIRTEGAVNDVSGWNITVPYLDSFSGSSFAELNDSSESIDGEAGGIAVILSCVDKLDGDHHELVRLRCGISDISLNEYAYADGWIGGDPNNEFFDEVVSGDTSPRLDYQVTLVGNRSEIIIMTKFFPDRTDSDVSVDDLATVDVEDYLVDASQEFVITLRYSATYTSNDISFTAGLIDFGYIDKDSFAGMGPPAAVLKNRPKSGGFDIFKIILDFLSFRWLGEIIVNGLTILGEVLSVPLDFLITLASDIVSGFLTFIGDFLDDAITWLTGAMATVSEFLQSLLNAIIDLFIPAEIQALFAWMVTGTVQFFTGLPQLLTDWTTFLLAIFSLMSVLGFIAFFIFPIAQGRDVGGFLSHMFENMGFDITFGVTILGIGGNVPAVIPWAFIVVFTMLLGTPFIGFF